MWGAGDFVVVARLPARGLLLSHGSPLNLPPHQVTKGSCIAVAARPAPRFLAWHFHLHSATISQSRCPNSLSGFRTHPPPTLWLGFFSLCRSPPDATCGTTPPQPPVARDGCRSSRFATFLPAHCYEVHCTHARSNTIRAYIFLRVLSPFGSFLQTNLV